MLPTDSTDLSGLPGREGSRAREGSPQSVDEARTGRVVGATRAGATPEARRGEGSGTGGREFLEFPEFPGRRAGGEEEEEEGEEGEEGEGSTFLPT